jgi:hypothetical protein
MERRREIAQMERSARRIEIERYLTEEGHSYTQADINRILENEGPKSVSDIGAAVLADMARGVGSDAFFRTSCRCPRCVFNTLTKLTDLTVRDGCPPTADELDAPNETFYTPEDEAL